MQGLWGCENILDSPERPQFQMISFTLDPQWCGLLFSIYCRNEKTSVLGPDAFSTCTLAGPPLDADWIAFAGSVGVEICRLSSSWALIFETVKASGVILLLGVGSLVCYKLYHYYWPGSRSRLNSPNSSPPHSRYDENFVLYHVCDDNQLVEDLDDEDINNIEGRYFGPSPAPSKNSLQNGIDVAKFLKISKYFSIIPSYSENDVTFDRRYEERGSEESHLEKHSNSSLTSSPCGLQHFRHGPWSDKQNITPGIHRASLRDQNIISKDDDSSWIMKRLRNMLSVSNDGQQNLGSASLPVTPGSRLKHRNRERKTVSNWEDGWKSASFGMFRNSKSCTTGDGSSRIASRKSSFGSNCSPILIHSRMTKDQSFDSLGFVRKLPREGSFDSTCSELSLDISLPEAPSDNNTMMCLDNLQHEIDQLKNSCLMMDEEFETIKCNRNLPGMSSLMNVNANSNHRLENKVQSPHDALQDTIAKENARACFAGLYSLTTIKNSTSSELSDSFVGNGRGSVGSAESLAWDSPIAIASPVKVGENDQTYCEKVDDSVVHFETYIKSPLKKVAEEIESNMLNEEAANIYVYDNSMVELEWDEDGLDDYIGEECDLSHTRSERNDDVSENMNGNCKLEKSFTDESIDKTSNMMKSTLSTSVCSERSSKAESSGFESKLTDSTITDKSSQWLCDWDQNVNLWNSDALEESGFLEWDSNINCSRQVPGDWSEGCASLASCSEQSTPMSDVSNSEVGSPMSNFPSCSTTVTENIGPKVNIFEYAMREWQGQTKKAETILKGYAEIPSLLGVQYLRRIRGDNYCGVRASLFQILSKGLKLPCGSSVFAHLSNACNLGDNKWLQNWNFADRLPYQSSNVLHGMKSCLHSLDNMISVLSSSEDRLQTLVALLNQNPSLDLHLMEAVKLHMLMCAMELYNASSAGLDVPLFAMLMFARDTSETPRDLMNNHLKNVGNLGGLEQVEMFLLGYALKVTLKVVRPAAYGTEDFICCYPDWNLGVWPEVVLVAEDDRHYNVLVN